MTTLPDEANGRLTIAVVSGIFALTTTLVPVVDNWRQHRDAKQRANSDLDFATKQVGFWKTWLDARSSATQPEETNGAKQIAIDNLLRIAAKQELRLLEELKGMLPLVHRPWHQRVLFLYKPRRSTAWLPRILFYVSTIYLVEQIYSLKTKDYRDPLLNALLMVVFGFLMLFHHIARRMSE